MERRLDILLTYYKYPESIRKVIDQQIYDGTVEQRNQKKNKDNRFPT